VESGAVEMPTSVRFVRPAKCLRQKSRAERFFEIVENRDLQFVMIFCLIGLLTVFALIHYFPDLGLIIAENNQF
jgi:hypothetical protein